MLLEQSKVRFVNQIEFSMLNLNFPLPPVVADCLYGEDELKSKTSVNSEDG